MDSIYFLCLGLLLFQIILSIYIIFKPAVHKTLNTFFALLIIADTQAHISFLSTLIYNRHFLWQYTVGLGYCALLVMGPAIFFYVYLSLGYKSKPLRKILIHFVPASAAFLYYIYYQTSPLPVQNKLYGLCLRQLPPFLYMNILSRGTAFGYLMFTILFVLRIRKKREFELPFPEKKKFTWIYTFLIILMIHGFLSLPLTFILPTSFPLIIALISLIIINIFIFKMIRDPTILEPLDIIEQITLHKPDEQNYCANEQLVQRIELYMSLEKPYLQKGITIVQLACLINISKHDLSILIRRHYKKNYFDYMNTYRVEEAKERLTAEGPLPKLEVIAADSGFNSKATFFDIFKQQTGITPANYRKIHKKVV